MKSLEKRKRNLKLLDSLSEDSLQMLEAFNKCNKHAKRFIRDIFNINPYFWDYGFLLSMERMYFIRLREQLLKEQLFVGYERVCEQIQTCIKLLDIIEGKNNPVHIKFNKGEKFTDENGFYNHKHSKYEIKKYVNTRNATRFLHPGLVETLSKDTEGGKALLCSELYEAKAWHLYYKIREYYMKGWWS